MSLCSAGRATEEIYFRPWNASFMTQKCRLMQASSQRSFIFFFNLKTMRRCVLQHVPKGSSCALQNDPTIEKFSRSVFLMNGFLMQDMKLKPLENDLQTPLGNACVINLMINEFFWWVLLKFYSSCAEENEGTTIGTHWKSNICSTIDPFLCPIDPAVSTSFRKILRFCLLRDCLRLCCLLSCWSMMNDILMSQRKRCSSYIHKQKRRQSFAIVFTTWKNFFNVFFCELFLLHFFLPNAQHKRRKRTIRRNFFMGLFSLHFIPSWGVRSA